MAPVTWSAAVNIADAKDYATARFALISANAAGTTVSWGAAPTWTCHDADFNSRQAAVV